MAAGLDVDELELMDPDDRAEALEEAGLDPDDYDFDWVFAKEASVKNKFFARNFVATPQSLQAAERQGN